MRLLTKGLSIFAAWPLLIALLLGSILFVAFTPGFYIREYERLNQAEVIGCAPTVLENITHQLVAYIRGGANAPQNLVINALINDEYREVFSEKEQQHMFDVKYLFDMARYIAVICSIAAVLSLACAALFSLKGSRTRDMCTGLLWGMASFSIICAALAVYALIDFSSFWTNFHQVFFTNDLWLLDPSKDVLIQMMPERFFVNMATNVTLIFTSVAGVIAVSAAILRFISERRLVTAPEKASETTANDENSVTVIPEKDGQRIMLPEGNENERPDANQIFKEFGLSDADDKPLLPDEPATAQPLAPRFIQPFAPNTATAPAQAPISGKPEDIRSLYTNVTSHSTFNEFGTIRPMLQKQEQLIQTNEQNYNYDKTAPAKRDIPSMYDVIRRASYYDTPQPENTPPPEKNAENRSFSIPPEENVPEITQHKASPADESQVAGIDARMDNGSLSVRVPVTIPASAIDITRLKDGIKLDLKLELYLSDDGTLGPALTQLPEKPDGHEQMTPAAMDPENSIDDLLSRIDRIMADFPEAEETNVR